MRKLETSIDYRKKADDIWEQARSEEELGHYDLSNYLKDVATQLHDFARKKAEEEEIAKNSN
jgi:hypothetical protein